MSADGGSPAFDVAPTAAFEFVRLKMSTMACSFLWPDMVRVFDTRTSSCVRRGVYMVPGLISGTTRDVLAPPESGRPSVPAAASACVMFHCARICCPGRFWSTPATWICCHGNVYDPFSFACDSQLVS